MTAAVMVGPKSKQTPSLSPCSSSSPFLRLKQGEAGGNKGKEKERVTETNGQWGGANRLANSPSFCYFCVFPVRRANKNHATLFAGMLRATSHRPPPLNPPAFY